MKRDVYDWIIVIFYRNGALVDRKWNHRNQ